MLKVQEREFSNKCVLDKKNLDNPKTTQTDERLSDWHWGALTLCMNEQKHLPHRADLDDAVQASHKDEPLKHNDQTW